MNVIYYFLCTYTHLQQTHFDYYYIYYFKNQYNIYLQENNNKKEIYGEFLCQ